MGGIIPKPNKEEKPAEPPLALTILPGGPEKIFPDCIPADIRSMIHDYWNFNCAELIELRKPQPGFFSVTFYESYFTPNHLVALAGHYVVYGQKNELMYVLEKHPEIVNPKHVAEVEDPLGRRILGNLLRIAFAAGAFYIAKILVDFALNNKLLTKDQIQAEIAAHFPLDWADKIAERMQRYIDAGNEFISEVKKGRNQETFKGLELACEDVLRTFQQKIQLDSNEVVTTGLVYDPRVCDKFYQSICPIYFQLSHIQTNYLMIKGYGGLQRLMSVADVPHIGGAFNGSRFPAFLSSEEIFSYYNPDELGNLYFIDDTGVRRESIVLHNGAAGEYIMRTKKEALENLFDPPAPRLGKKQKHDTYA